MLLYFVVVWNNDTQSVIISPENGTILDPEDGCVMCRLNAGWNSVNTEPEQIYGIKN